MKVENLSALEIHKLSQEQYDREYEAGNIDETAIYLTTDDGTEQELTQTINEDSASTQVPSAKAVFELISGVDSASLKYVENPNLWELNSGLYHIENGFYYKSDSQQTMTKGIMIISKKTDNLIYQIFQGEDVQYFGEIAIDGSDGSCIVKEFSKSADVENPSDSTYLSETAIVNLFNEVKSAIPETLPADGGNADTVDGKHAEDFANAEHEHEQYVLKTDVSSSTQTLQESITQHTENANIHVTLDEKATWNNKSDFSGDYNDLTNKPEIPSIEGLASETYVNEKVSQVDIPSALSDLTEDETHRVVSDVEKATWNAKSNFSGSYNDLTDKPEIPSIEGLATETFVNSAVSTKADSEHNHDDVYYTETEVDTKFTTVNQSIDTLNSEVETVKGDLTSHATSSNTQFETIRSEFAQADTSTLTTAKEYSDANKSAAITEAKAYTDSEIEKLVTDTEFEGVLTTIQEIQGAMATDTELTQALEEANGKKIDKVEKGSSTKPIYLDSTGTPQEIAYKIEQDLPADAKLTDTTYTLIKDATQKKIQLMSGETLVSEVDDNNTTYEVATTSNIGLLSAEDKTKLDTIETGATKTVIDSELSDSSTNPVQNKIINSALANKVDKVSGKGLSEDNFTTAEKNKLAGIASGANAYTHPTTAGNKHIPSGGSSGQILRWSSDGTAVWGADNNTTYSAATTSTAGLMSSADKTKLNGIATGANAYTHPTTSGNKHIPSGGSSGQILRWSADGTAAWGADNNTIYSAATQSVNGLMSAADKKKLDGIATSANAYSHPTTSGNKHIPSGGADTQILTWSADGTAKWVDHTQMLFMDTRYVNTSPSDMPVGLSLHLKANGYDGLNDGHAYHPTLMMKSWFEKSGGPWGELALTTNNNLWFRTSVYGSDTDWRAWRRVATMDLLWANPDPYSPFAGQIIYLPEVANYSVFMITAVPWCYDGGNKSLITFKNSGTSFSEAVYWQNTWYSIIRGFTIKDDSVVISDGANLDNIQNERYVPWYIHGLSF